MTEKGIVAILLIVTDTTVVNSDFCKVTGKGIVATLLIVTDTTVVNSDFCKVTGKGIVATLLIVTDTAVVNSTVLFYLKVQTAISTPTTVFNIAQSQYSVEFL